jgi:hypothetical protein
MLMGKGIRRKSLPTHVSPRQRTAALPASSPASVPYTVPDSCRRSTWSGLMSRGQSTRLSRACVSRVSSLTVVP